MFNWFKSKKQHDITDDAIASITYYVSKENVVKLDMSMEDYDDNSVNAIVSLLEVLSKESCFVETLSFFQSAMNQNERDDIVARVFIHLGNIVQAKKEKQDEQERSPYIKPSDLSKG
jgi:hypothetical protein